MSPTWSLREGVDGAVALCDGWRAAARAAEHAQVARAGSSCPARANHPGTATRVARACEVLVASREVAVSATEGKALFVLLSLPNAELLRRPVSALADATGVSRPRAQRIVSALKQCGLIQQSGRYGIKIVVPTRGWTYHRHPVGAPCFGAVEMSSGKEMRAAIDQVAECVVCPRPEGIMSRKAVVERLRGELALHERTRGRPSSATSRQGRLLIAAYTAARRRFTPGYRATGGDFKKAGKVVRTLATRLIGQDLYKDYVAYAVAAFGRITKKKEGAPPCPPVAFLGSETIIDGFVGELPPRTLNVERAQELLRKAKIEADPGMAVTIAKNLLEETAEMPEGLPDDLERAVRFVVEHIEHIGYRPIEKPGPAE